MFTEKLETEEDEYHITLNQSSATFAVLQSVVDFQPDVDAIFRLTRKTPFSFRGPSNLEKGTFKLNFTICNNNFWIFVNCTT